MACRLRFDWEWAVPIAGIAATAGILLVFAPWRNHSMCLVLAAMPDDPRLAYAGPYLNIHPGVRFIGDAVCAGCHQDKSETFRHHPMGRSMLSLAEANKRALETPEHHNPFESLGMRFRIDRDGDRVWHREYRLDSAGKPIFDKSFEVHHVIGSGNHGHSYLSVRDGYVVQTPISWYASKQIWDLSPGMTEVAAGRVVSGKCLFCHANQFEPVSGSLNRFEQPLFRGAAIGCERCHGPGEKHVAAWNGASPAPKGQDFTIVNPARLEPKLRDAVCEQCHLEGEAVVLRRGRGVLDFRPGLPLEEFWSMFVKAAGDSAHFVNHVEQMVHSGCYRGSTSKPNQIGCISCHDPHVKVGPDERAAHYRERCLNCHMDKGCSVPESERRKSSSGDSCVDCHMPRFPTSDISHTSATDHSIPRKPGKPPPAGSAGSRELPIRRFHPLSLGDDGNRDLGIALAEMIQFGKLDRQYGYEAIERLEKALRQHPGDVDAWEAKAAAAMALERWKEAASAAETAISIQPNRESAVWMAAVIARMQNRPDESIRLSRRAIELNPFLPHYRANLAMLLEVKKDWDSLKPQVEAWLQLDPASIEARKVWVSYLLHTGARDKAKVEFARIEALKPKNLDELRTWFREQTK